MAKTVEMKEVREAADYICKKLNGQGFHILRYDPPYSSYIKIDGGLCNTIRVSAHGSSKEHLSYRYNVLVGLDENYSEVCDKGYTKHFITSDKKELDSLINSINNKRTNSIKKYGELNYLSYVLNALKDNKDNTSGFWSKAKTLRNTNNKKYDYSEGIVLTKKLKNAKNQIQARKDRKVI